MFTQGQMAVYGSHGVCVFLESETRTIDRKPVQYYVLEPVEQPGARFYVPKANPAAISKLSPLLSRQELNDLLRSEKESEQDYWIPEENRRKQRYRELIGSTDRSGLIAMVRCLHLHRKSQLEQGKKFHQCDENFLRDAERLLCGEFALVLGIEKNQVGEYIRSHLVD